MKLTLQPSDSEQNVWVVSVTDTDGKPSVEFPDDLDLLQGVSIGDQMIFIQTDEGWQIKTLSANSPNKTVTVQDYVDLS